MQVFLIEIYFFTMIGLGDLWIVAVIFQFSEVLGSCVKVVGIIDQSIQGMKSVQLCRRMRVNSGEKKEKIV